MSELIVGSFRELLAHCANRVMPARWRIVGERIVILDLKDIWSNSPANPTIPDSLSVSQKQMLSASSLEAMER